MEAPAHRVLSSFVLGSLLAACSGSSKGSSSSLTVTVTGTASDELSSCVVEIVAIELTRAEGGTVSVLPEPLPVDFVALEDTSRVLDLRSVPPGDYTEAAVTLDLSSANVYLVGKPVAASVHDGDGLPFSGTLTLPIQLLGALDVEIGRNHVLELDFDLAHSVSADREANEVLVEPAVFVRVDPPNPKELALAGVFRSHDDELGFWLAIDSSPTAANLVPIAVDPRTVYQIDGVPLVGPAGLTALDALPAGEWVQVFGTADTDSPTIIASSVEVGRGTYDGGSDIVEGHVIGRSGAPGTSPTLTVLGHSVDSLHAVFQYNRVFTVTTDIVNTKVVRSGSAATYDTDELKVGQRVRFFGSLNGLDLAANAATDVARLQPTRVQGFALGDHVPGSPLELDVQREDERPVGAVTWAGSGTSPANPASLEVEVGTLADQLEIEDGMPVEVVGFFSGAGDPAEDFVASSVGNRALRRFDRTRITIHDRAGGLVVVPTITAEEIRFTLSGTCGARELALVDAGLAGVLPLPAGDTTVVPGKLGQGHYALRDRVTGATAVHLSFEDFTLALQTVLLDGAVIHDFGATGVFDETTTELATNLVSVVVQ